MSVRDLNDILNKEPVITTWPASYFSERASDIEQDYATHAKTHIPLGDTTEYVERVFRWVSGQNKGALIGGVVGDYGEGKTSFLVHLWDQSRERDVLTIPPFEWVAFEDLLEAPCAWMLYRLRETHPVIARKIENLRERYREQSIEQMAKEMAADRDASYDEALEYARALANSDSWQRKRMSGREMLDFVEELADLAVDAGYEGLLLLLDEPEVATKQLGLERVSQFLFELADEIHRRQGNYGLFVSLPRNFFASISARFSSLTARLQQQKCLPRLSNMYGSSFARDLWLRYRNEFGLDDADRMVSPLILKGLGQSTSAARKDLSFGPRSVVQTFVRILQHYQESGETYTPELFIRDLQRNQLLFQDAYVSKVNAVLSLPQIGEEDEDLVRLLSIFPDGLPRDVAEELGYDERLRELSRPGGIVYGTTHTYALKELQRDSGQQEDELRNRIVEIDAEFVPGRETFDNALDGFVSDLLPRLFPTQKGLQLQGWNKHQQMDKVSRGVRFGTMIGAFEETERDYPMRAFMVLATSIDTSWQDVDIKVVPLVDESGPQQYDVVFHFAFRWNEQQDLPTSIVEISEGAPDSSQVTLVRLNLDLVGDTIEQDRLAEIVGSDRLTPLWTLNLLSQMSKVQVGRQQEAFWESLRDQLARQLPACILDKSVSEAIARTLSTQFEEEVQNLGVGRVLLGNVASLVLQRRYPKHATLIKQPRWKSKVDDYIKVLQNSTVPLACKQGKRPWEPTDDQAELVFGTSRMNLSGGAFAGFESLIEIESQGRNKPLAIEFKPHPVEEAIVSMLRDMPSDGKQTMSVDGERRPFVYARNLMEEALAAGYIPEELRRIIAIGKARNSFEIGKYRGEQVVCRHVLDIDDMKHELREKLEELLEEIKLFNRIPGFSTRFDPAPVRDAIEHIQDRADYRDIMEGLARERQRNAQILPDEFERLDSALQDVQRKVNEEVRGLARSSFVRSLESPPKASSPWCGAFVKCAYTNIKDQTDHFIKTYEKLVRTIRTLRSQYEYSREQGVSENLARLLEGREKLVEVRDDWNMGRQERKKFVALANQYNEWSSKLLPLSDRLQEQLLELRGQDAHKKMAERLLADYESLSDEIAEHLIIYNIHGLENYQQFLDGLKKIDQQRETYLREAREIFNQLRLQVNEWLSKTRLDRIRATFDPLNPEASYESLFAQAAEAVKTQGLKRASLELAEQRVELAYATDILEVLESGVLERYQDRIDDVQTALQELQDQVDADWLRSQFENEDNTELKRTTDCSAEAFELIHEVQRTVWDATRPELPEKGSGRQVYELFGEEQEMELTQLVLGMMDQGDTPKNALDTTLEGLTQLFRNNCVQITVKRRK